MKKACVCILIALCASLLFQPSLAYAENKTGIIVATGQDVPIDNKLPEEYRVPEKYTENAVQFVTGDGILLCGYVLGEGDQGITLGHANGWMVKSWLPFGERLVDAGYMVIIWEFRNIAPSGPAPASARMRWDLDVLAAAQVLRERGATEIVAMGASDGGNATAVAAPSIPDLAGLALLSSPSHSKGDAVAAVRIIDVPAFFAVSSNDPGGTAFYDHVKSLYDACASEQKEFHVLTSYEHGSDLLSDNDVSSALSGSTEEQKQERRELADNLMRFVDHAFGNGIDKSSNGESDVPVSVPIPDNSEMNTSASIPDNNKTPTPKPKEPGNISENANDGAPKYSLLIGLALLFTVTIATTVKRKKR